MQHGIFHVMLTGMVFFQRVDSVRLLLQPKFPHWAMDNLAKVRARHVHPNIEEASFHSQHQGHHSTKGHQALSADV
jgi:hypothetical protein